MLEVNPDLAAIRRRPGRSAGLPRPAVANRLARMCGPVFSPVRFASRSAALLVIALLLLGAWAVAASLQAWQVQRDAAASLAMAGQAVAAAIDAPLQRFIDLTDGLRGADFQPPDRVAVTARLLRLQSSLPHVGATFMVAANGQLLAASGPLPSAETFVGEAAWFRRALADNPKPLVVQRVDASWLRAGPTVLVTRVVADSAGRQAGLVGAVLRLEDLAQLARPAWLPPEVAIALHGADGTTILDLPGADFPDEHGAAPPLDGIAGFGARLMSALDRLTDVPGQIAATTKLAIADATLRARADADLALRRQWPDHARGLRTLGLWLLAVWGFCLVLVFSFRAQRGGAAPAAAANGFGVDWQVELDQRGEIIAVHGYAPDVLREAVGRKLLDVLAAAPGGEAARRLTEALEAQTAIDSMTLAAPAADGQERMLRVRVDPLPDGRLLCGGRDVTSELRAEARAEAAAAERGAAEAQAEVITGDRDRVLAALGHDVRTPMNSIMGICALLLESELEQEQRTWLERIRASCEALLAMLNGLLEIAGGEVGGGGLQREEIDVVSLVQEVAEVLEPQARDKGLDLRTRFDDLVRGQWMVDPTRLRQVLFNLLGNAVKFTASGHVEVRVAAPPVPESGTPSLKIAVSDTGPGIVPEERDIIFERFRRGGVPIGSGHEGLGLGLALCRENAVLMDGSLTLESALGVGSEFTFEFPAERVADAGRVLPFAGRTALIVGDEDAMCRTIAGALADLGITVETAPDGYLGLALAERMEAQRGALDLVLVRSELAGMPAEVFVIRLHAATFGSRTELVWLGEGGAAEVDAIVPAPVDPFAAVTVARQLLGQRSPLDVLEPAALLARGGRILLVEDDRVNQSLLAAALTRRGFSVFVASNGEEAVRLASRDSFDAVVMDIQLPQIDGFEATRRIRGLRGRVADIPIVALTALKGPFLRKRCDEAGFTAMLEKPVNLDRLGATLRRCIADGRRVGDVPPPPDRPGVGGDPPVDVSVPFLEEMVAVIGIDRARACIADFIADAVPRCRRLGELVPGWEVDAILRSCEEISGIAETCGATGLGDVLEEIAGAVTRNDRLAVLPLMARLETATRRLEPTLTASLDDVARRWASRGSQAA
jgi:signal transduction histidine kinase/CheY-like chemotaxis protein